jgi:hypothetical protein
MTRVKRINTDFFALQNDWIISTIRHSAEHEKSVVMSFLERIMNYINSITKRKFHLIHPIRVIRVPVSITRFIQFHFSFKGPENKKGVHAN